MKSVVKYKNEMNKLNFHGLRKNDMNLFMAICSKVKEKGESTIVIEFDYLRKISNYTGHTIEGFLKDLRIMSLKIMSVNCEILSDSGGFVLFHIFDKFIADPEKATLTIKINTDFAWLLNEFTDKIKGYTIFELQEFVGLQSKYAKNLYRILKQWRTTGEFIFNNLDDFRQKLDVPDSYKNKRLMEKVIKPAVIEIQALDKSFENFKCEPLYLQKRGKPLAGYKFTWNPENKRSKTEYSDKEKNNTEKNRNYQNKFANFTQRTYDYNALEAHILNKRDNQKDDQEIIEEGLEEDFKEILKNLRNK